MKCKRSIKALSLRNVVILCNLQVMNMQAISATMLNHRHYRPATGYRSIVYMVKAIASQVL